MRVLVTGNAGFIGSHLADRLFVEGHDVWGVDNMDTGREANVHPGVHFSREDIGAYDGRLSCLFYDAKPDVVVHCAASYKNPHAWYRDIDTNALGTAAVASHAKEAGARLIYLQTALCYGSNPGSHPLRLDQEINPENSYAISKVAGERYIRLSGVPALIFRLANIYGPRNLSGPIPTFFKKLKEGQECVVVDTRRDFVFIDDFVDLLSLAVGSKLTGTYHVASGGDYSIREIYSAVQAATGTGNVSVAVRRRAEDDAATIRLDGSQTWKTWGWQPTTLLMEGVRKAVEWYEKNGVTETYTHLRGESVAAQAFNAS